jgi:hypothetical protein
VTVAMLTVADDLQVGGPVVHAHPVPVVHVQALELTQAQKMPGHEPVEPDQDRAPGHDGPEVGVAPAVNPARETTPRGALLAGCRSRCSS